MNPTWTSFPFAKLNREDSTHNEASWPETYVLEEILRVNESTKRRNRSSKEKPRNDTEISPKSYAKTSTNENDRFNEGFKDQTHETHVQVTSRSVSCLQRRNVSSSFTVTNVHSKTTLNRTDLGHESFSEGKNSSGKVHSERSPIKRNEEEKKFSGVVEVDDKSENLIEPSSQRRRVKSPSKQEESQVLRNGGQNMRNIEEIAIGDSLFSCPVELVEIYLNEKGRSGRNDLDKESVEVNRGSGSLRTFPEEDEQYKLVSKENSFPMRGMNWFKEEVEHLKEFNERKSTKNGDSSVAECAYSSRYNESTKGALERKEKEDIAVIEKENRREKQEIINSITFYRSNDNKKNEDFRANESTYSSKLNNTTNNTEDLGKLKTVENVLPLVDKENRRKNCESSDTFDSHKLNTSDGKISKITLKSDESNFPENSKSDSSAKYMTTDFNERKLNAEVKTLNAQSTNGSKMMMVSEKPENQNKVRAIGDDKIGSRVDNVQSSTIIDGSNKKQDSEDLCKDIATMEIEVNENTGKTQNINTCNVLTKIHERLTCDWQRMERLRMKLQCNILPDATNWTMMLQLLDKTVARCKSYIHGSRDSRKAETAVTKLLSKDIVDLVRIVNKNRLILEDQERRVDQMQLESLRGQNASKKRGILNEITMTSNYWTNEISCSIETISSLVKNVITDNEEKENVREEKSPRKNKTIQRRVTNTVSNDAKQRSGMVRSKNPKVNLVKRESTVETQMSIVSNSVDPLAKCRSRISTKPLCSSRNAEKEKRQDDGLNSVIEKKMAENSRHSEKVKPGKKITTSTIFNQQKQFVSRQKHRNFGNQQPVWRPGGSVRIPSSSSATTLTQKSRPSTHTRETAKEEKHGRATNNWKKRPSTEVHSTKETVSSLDIDPPWNHKMADKRSNASLKIAPKVKSPRCRVSSRSYNKDTSLCDVIDREVSKESRVLRALEKIVKGTPENAEEKIDRNLIRCYEMQDETSPVSFRQPALVEEEMKINEEEPTRDIDCNQFKKNLINIDEVIENFSEKSSAPVVSKNFVPFPVTNDKIEESAGTGGNLEDFQAKNRSDFASVTSASCTMNFNTSSSDCISKEEDFRHCETSFNSVSSSIVSRQEERNEESKENDVSRACSLNCNEKQGKFDAKNLKSLSISKEEKTKVNFHALSLSMLKEFLCEQGIDVDLVNKAEKYLKDKQKSRKYLKKKSTSFADVPSNVDNKQQLEKNTKNEYSWKKKTERNAEKPEENSANFRDSNKISLQSAPKMKDIATCTVRNRNDISFLSKCLQTIPEDDSSTTKLRATETQTEMEEEKYLANERCKMDLKNERRNMSSMTVSLPVCNHSMETVRIPRVSKSAATDFNQETSDCSEKNSSENFCKNSNDLPSKTNLQTNSNNFSSKDNFHGNSSDIPLTSQINSTKNDDNEDDKNKHEERDESSLNHEEDDQINESSYDESNLSTATNFSSSCFISSERGVDENEAKEENESPVKVIPSEISAAFQVGAIKDRNLHRAIEIYERTMRSKLKKSEKETKRKRRRSKIAKISRKLKNWPESNSSIKIVVKKKNNDKRGIVEHFKVLRQAEIRSSFGKTSFDLCNNSKEETSESVETSSTTIISSETNFGNIQVEIPIRSSSSVVLKEAISLVEFLVKKTEDVKFEGTECVRKIGSGNTRLGFCENTNANVEKVKKEFSLLSRKNLLSLLYGILCSVVFWCLQFTITCDVVSS
ncbi:hypothetical protein WH47_07518 [Habropoda laboriosa]|uniref:Uncharacterized protein n=1 Tax=Habropoda laboriosa TaxID=597456 RepID=A0A0L7RG17_9HYME|nr:hypothetical protein WH47_07518 [Habropoda laboriosa]